MISHSACSFRSIHITFGMCFFNLFLASLNSLGFLNSIFLLLLLLLLLSDDEHIVLAHNTENLVRFLQTHGIFSIVKLSAA